MLPLVYPLLAYDARVSALVGARIFRFGWAPQKVEAPYITWGVVAGNPENNLSDYPPCDRWEVQVDCWSENTGSGDHDIEVLGEAVRDAIERQHHITDMHADRDPETGRYRIMVQFTFWADRDPLLTGSGSSGSSSSSDGATQPEAPAYTLWRTVHPIAEGGMFDGAYIPNQSALWRVISLDAPQRWSFYPGGGYVFNAMGAAPGEYVMTYEVRDWDGQGNDATATVTVVVE